MQELLARITKCTICQEHLEHGVNPVVSISSNSKILIIGQAPGMKVHKSGIPWDDVSGRNLRSWLGVSEKQFYNTDYFGIMPMGFCYPGKGSSGDLPPRPECAPQWHKNIFSHLRRPTLTLLIGAYAQQYYLGPKSEKTLTLTVKNFEKYLPDYLVLPHPSPRNNIWQSKNPWFQENLIPKLRSQIKRILN